MKKLSLYCALFLAFTCQGQRFYDNGLLYSDQTLAWTKPYFDSLHRIWANRPSSSQIKSAPYMVFHPFSLDTLVKRAKADIDAGISLPEFRKIYPTASVSDVQLSSNVPDQVLIRQSHFVLDLFRKGENGLDDGYISGDFVEKVVPGCTLPKQYAEWVQYYDFLTGGEQLFLSNHTCFSEYALAADRPHRDRFFAYIHIPDPPKMPTIRQIPVYLLDYKTVSMHIRPAEQYRIWQEKRDLYIQQHLCKQPEFKKLLEAAVDECLAMRLPDALLESWAFQYLDTDKAIQLMRMRPVFSDCGNDPGPTQRVYEIGQILSKEISYPRLMLLVQLRLIDDNSDWSCQSNKRFVGELEALGIDVAALLLGSVIQTADHQRFRSTLSRVGWALQECKNHEAIGEIIRRAIADEALDELNRANLFAVYGYMMERKYWKLNNKVFDHAKVERDLQSLRGLLPAYLRESSWLMGR